MFDFKVVLEFFMKLLCNLKKFELIIEFKFRMY